MHRYTSVGSFNFDIAELGRRITGTIKESRLRRIQKVLDNLERKKIASLYRNSINNHKIKHPVEFSYSYNVYHLYVVTINKQRKKFIKYLNDNDVFPGIHYPIPVHMQKAYKKYISDVRLINTEKIINQIVSIPIYQGMTNEDIHKVINLINDY